MKEQVEWVPWYRRKGFRGNLTELEKRHLDSFRSAERHPAAQYHDLPDEVQQYICEIELALYDRKQEALIGVTVGLTGIGAFLLFVAYHDLTWGAPLTNYLLGAGLIVLAWGRYVHVWKKNAEDLWIKNEGPGIPFSRTQEAIQRNWELEEISRFRSLKRMGPGSASREIGE